MSKIYIASTMAASVEYTGWTEAVGNNLPRISQSVTIAGGAGVANKRLETPRGVITAVTVEEAKFLQEHPVFKRHAERGYVAILAAKPADPDDAAADMTGRDNSAPLVDADFVDEDNAPAAVGGKRTKRGG